jgi:hypothetical protein
MVSLDCALGPSDHPYSLLRYSFAEFYEQQQTSAVASPEATVDLTVPDAQDTAKAAEKANRQVKGAIDRVETIAEQNYVGERMRDDVNVTGNPGVLLPHSPNHDSGHGVGVEEHSLDQRV